MADIILDLSGRAGLADNFYGDADTITPLPNLRIAKKESDLVSGLFNPYLRDGYLAPATTTNTDLTISQAAESQFGSVEYDHKSGYIYYADRVNSLYSLSSLTDTSITYLDSLETSEFQDYDEIHDLQMYQINGERKLFYSGRGSFTPSGWTTASYPEIKVATIPSANDWAAASVSIRGAGGNTPTILGSFRDFQVSSSSTTTTSITTTTGTNTCLVVIAAQVGNQTVTGITFNGDAMTVQSSSANTTSGIYVYYLANPDVATGNIVVTYSGAVTNRLVYAINTNNTDQTELIRASPKVDTTETTIITHKRIYAENQLTLVAAFSDEVMSYTMTGVTSLYDTTNAYGSDGLFYFNENGLMLHVGVANLPVTTVSDSDATWLLGTATNGFGQEVFSDYCFLRTADNGFAYVFADNTVHKIDGTITGGANGTVTRNVLLFPDYFRITDAIDYRSRLYLAIHQYPINVSDTSLNTFTGKVGIYVWNRVSTQLSSADFIELPGVREIKKIFASPDGQLRLIAISDNGLTELRQFGYNDSGGVVFPVIKTLGVGAYPQFPDGLTIAGDKVVWLANDGKMYCNKENYVTQLYQAKAPGATTATLESNITTGTIFYGSGDETGSTGYRSNKQAITYSYLDGSTHVIEKIYPFDLKTGANGAQTSAQGDVYTAVMFIPTHSVVRNVRVYNAPVAGSGTTEIATVKLYFNQSTTVGMTKTITKDEAKRGYVDFKINKPYIHAIQVEIEWSTSINLDGDIYLPSTAVISHEPTTGQSPDNG